MASELISSEHSIRYEFHARGRLLPRVDTACTGPTTEIVSFFFLHDVW